VRFVSNTFIALKNKCAVFLDVYGKTQNFEHLQKEMGGVVCYGAN